MVALLQADIVTSVLRNVRIQLGDGSAMIPLERVRDCPDENEHMAHDQ